MWLPKDSSKAHKIQYYVAWGAFALKSFSRDIFNGAKNHFYGSILNYSIAGQIQ